MTAELRAWLGELDDDYLTGWANRGLLRRGRKLAAGAGAPVCEQTDDGWTATLEGQRQTLTGAGFDKLGCSCPADQTCHHLLAFLLLLKKQLDEQPPSVDPQPAEPPPWLAADLKSLSKTLGAGHCRKARELLLQALPVTLEETAAGLGAEVNDGASYRVRVSRALGLAGSTCSCGAERCRHRALAVLYARQQAGLYDPAADHQDALNAAQQQAVDELQGWLQEFTQAGINGLARQHVERGEALATLTRQADLPLLAATLSGLTTLAKDELAGRSFIAPNHLATQLAQLWLRLRALRQVPLPQPLSVLAGSHRRHYRAVGPLTLIVAGAERWQSKTDYLGLTLYCYCPDDGRWYRHTQARAAAQADTAGWSPEDCWRRERWTPTLAPYRQLPGSSLRLTRGWATAAGQLSGREGTELERLNDSTATQPPAADDFARLLADYRQALAADPASPPPRLATLIAVAAADPPRFDELDQRWSQTVYDAAGTGLSLTLQAADPVSAAAVDKLGRLWRKRRRWRAVFGMLGLHDAAPAPQLTPVSLIASKDGPWQHLTLD